MTKICPERKAECPGGRVLASYSWSLSHLLPISICVLLRIMLALFNVLTLFYEQDINEYYNLPARCSMFALYVAEFIGLVVIVIFRMIHPPKLIQQNQKCFSRLEVTICSRVLWNAVAGVIYRFLLHLPYYKWMLVSCITMAVDYSIVSMQSYHFEQQLNIIEDEQHKSRSNLLDLAVDPGCEYLRIVHSSIGLRVIIIVIYLYWILFDWDDYSLPHLPVKVVFCLVFLVESAYYMRLIYADYPVNAVECRRYMRKISHKAAFHWVFLFVPQLYFSFFTEHQFHNWQMHILCITLDGLTQEKKEKFYTEQLDKLEEEELSKRMKT